MHVILARVTQQLVSAACLVHNYCRIFVSVDRRRLQCVQNMFMRILDISTFRPSTSSPSNPCRSKLLESR